MEAGFRLRYNPHVMGLKRDLVQDTDSRTTTSNPAGKLIFQGALLQAKIDPAKSRFGARKPIRRRHVKRGPVRLTWSRQSRVYFIKTVLRLLPALRVGTNYSITLTYREREPSASKRDLHTFQMRLRRFLKQNEWFAIWKMEFQRRGVVHYHLVLNLQCPLPVQEMRSYISRFWSEIVQDPQLAITGTRVDLVPMETVQQVMVYLIGHATSSRKQYQNHAGSVEWAGRWWGVWNKPNLPISEIPISEKEMHRLKRILAKIRPISQNALFSFWTYCDDNLFHNLLTFLR
jgi:hypothetical protein